MAVHVGTFELDPAPAASANAQPAQTGASERQSPKAEASKLKHELRRYLRHEEDRRHRVRAD